MKLLSEGSDMASIITPDIEVPLPTSNDDDLTHYVNLDDDGKPTITQPEYVNLADDRPVEDTERRDNQDAEPTNIEPLDISQQTEKEPLHFEIDLDSVNPEKAAVLQATKELAESLLWHWKQFTIRPPASVTDVKPDGNKPKASFHDLFMAPTFDELELVCMNDRGERKKLNARQLLSVQRNGEFEVESITFPGQVHKWRLAKFLQRGTARAEKSLQQNTALALQLLIITARNRICSDFFSLVSTGRNFVKACRQTLDLLIGLPATAPEDVTFKLHAEHRKFLVAELNVKNANKAEWRNFCEYFREKHKELQNNSRKQVQPKDIALPCPPYIYQTPKSTEIDMKLYNKDLMSKCMFIVRNVLKKESKGWHIKFKDKMVQELQEMNLGNTEISKRVQNELRLEYNRRVFDALRQSPELEQICPGIGDLLVQQAMAVLAMNFAVSKIKEKLQTQKQVQEELLRKSHSIKSNIKPWMHEQLDNYEREFVSQNLWTSHQDAIDACNEQGLEQAAYFLQRDRIFLRDREPVLRTELCKVRQPVRVFRFSARIWFPWRWVIRRHQDNVTSIIPTVITDLVPMQPTGSPGISYSCQKTHHFKVTTRYPFWRWYVYMKRTWAWILNTAFWLGLVIPWCSPVSIRALVYSEPFMPDLQVNQFNGCLCPDPRSKTQTLLSRLRLLWKHVRHCRNSFENSPDTGLLGKTLTRPMNILWNIVVKGCIGSTLIVMVCPLLCLLISSLSFVLAISSPIWMPFVTLIVHLFYFLIYDLDSPVHSGRALVEVIFWRLLCLCIIQPVAAVITATIICPLSSMSIMIFALLCRGVRAGWDTTLFHLLIKKHAKIPASNSWVARRVKGPGLASNYFYQIHPEQALAAVESYLEIQELLAWEQQCSKLIDEPQQLYSSFVSEMFGGFSAQLQTTGCYLQLVEESRRLHRQLTDTVQNQRRKLSTGISSDQQSRCKLPAKELELTLTQTAQMVERFFPDRVIARLPKTENSFWDNHNLDYRDWKGLASKILKNVFSSSFLQPLELTDNCFELKIQHLNLSRYVDMLNTAEFHDDLDMATTVHTPMADIYVDPPTLPADIFNPYTDNHTSAYNQLYNRQQTFRSKARSKYKLWKRTHASSTLQLLYSPLCISHPVCIALWIYNRENDHDPIAEDIILIRAACYVPYGTEMTLLTSYTDEASTPDQTTTSNGGSEPDVIVSASSTGHHLAHSEHAFSSDAASAGRTGSGSLSLDIDLDTQSNGGQKSWSSSSRGLTPSDDAMIDAQYQEAEADTSCVLPLDGDGDDDDTTEPTTVCSEIEVRKSLCHSHDDGSDDTLA